MASVHAGAGLYGPKDHVIEATAASFNKEVINFDGVVVVEFYGEPCSSCPATRSCWDTLPAACCGRVAREPEAAPECIPHVCGRVAACTVPTC